MKLVISGHTVIFDDEDAAFINSLSIVVYEFRKGQFYAIEQSSGRRIHRVIVGETNPKIVVDHKNGNPLDNRKENLRRCSQGDNTKNRRKGAKKTSSKYKGVHWHNGWMALIRVDYKRIYLGTFNIEDKAARAYNEGAVKYHGEFANLNVIEEHMAIESLESSGMSISGLNFKTSGLGLL